MIRTIVQHIRIYYIYLFVAVGCLAATQTVYAQEAPEKQTVKVTGGFIEDSLYIGKPIRFYLTARYPQELNIVFPDSSYNFAPFEFDSKKYEPTSTDDGISYDSVIYYVSTFEIDRQQYLSLPVYQLLNKDSVTYHSAQDTILVTQLVNFSVDTIAIDKLPMKLSTAYHDVPGEFNYPVFIAVAVVLLIIVVVVWFVFGKKIRRHFRIKNMLAAHRKFQESYTRELAHLRNAFSSVTTEAALAHWKIYMEQLEARPYTKLTTREARNFFQDESLIRNLQTIDGAIYGHNANVIEPLENLKAVADQRFHSKLQEIKHG
ncbi:MAG TPA: hypothetical protein VIN08_05020 [Ohtaekwangia sp.]|uniref:hypothetical protein n=1 Tax=Ohtaekwangia sp. TaxID=2066019 RepID=UPI002F94933C